MGLIKGKVAAIKSDYAIIINKGSEDGVREGMRFRIYEEGEDIKDPDTNEILGKLEYIKANVKVKFSSEKYSWAETYETITTNLLQSVVLGSFTKQERSKLPLDETSSIEDQDISLVVKVGDLVRQIDETSVAA